MKLTLKKKEEVKSGNNMGACKQNTEERRTRKSQDEKK